MLSNLHCFGVGVVLFSLAPPTLSFSRGASQSSCWEMIPGHIRAQPQEPRHSQVTLRTSTSSYLPGQLVTVTVRSSRDFMGFLLQARRVEGGRRTGGGIRSTRPGPVLVGGSWTLAPPGTHTLRCLSEGDTLTHSDKQLKRNLSFVWKAPDAPIGDIRFYITVVQSYFVYWAGIESTVVRDGSHHPWNGSNISGDSILALQEDEVTALPDPRAHRASSQLTKETTSSAPTLQPPTTASKGTQSFKSQETLREVTRPVLEMNTSGTLASLVVDHLTTQVVVERNIHMTLRSNQNATRGSETDTYATSGSLSGVTEEAGTDTGSTVTHTEDPKSSLFSVKHLPIIASFSSAEPRGMKATTTVLPKIKVQNSTNPLSLASLTPVKVGEMERKEAKIHIRDPKPHNVPKTEAKTINPHITITAVPPTSHSFHNTNPPRSKSQNSRRPSQGQTSSVKFKTLSSSVQPWKISITTSQISRIKETGSQSLPQPQNPQPSQTSAPKPFLQVHTSPFKPLFLSQTGTGQTFSVSQASSSKPSPKSQTSSPNLIPRFKTPTFNSFLQSHITLSFTEAHPLPLQPLHNKPLNVLSHYQTAIHLPKPQPENSLSASKTRQTSEPRPQFQTTESQPFRSLPQALPQTDSQADFLQTDKSQSDTPPKALRIYPISRSQPLSQTGALQPRTLGWKQTQPSVTPRSNNPMPFTSRFDPILTLTKGKDLQSQVKVNTMSSIFAINPSATISPSLSVSTLHFPSNSSTHILPSLGHRSATTPVHPSGDSTLGSIQTPFTHNSFSSSLSSSPMKNQPKTVPVLPALPSTSPISIPPHFPSVQPISSSPMPSSLTSLTIPSSYSSHLQSSSVPLSTSSSSSLTSTFSSTFSSPSSSTTSPTFSSSSIASSSSSISSASSPPSPPPLSSYISTSTPSSMSLGSTSSSLVSSHSNSPHPEPSPAPRHSLYNPLTSTSSSGLSQKLTPGQRLLIQNHIASSDPKNNLNLPTRRTVVHPNPEPHPNLDRNTKLNVGQELKPNLPNSDTKPRRPSSPSETPDKKGKYPDIIPRHSTWELGMLLGCSAGLGMVLVVGLRYMYRQTCGKRTEVTLNDRERESGRGERGLIHVQECGDLVRVRRIRENSFVLLAEYDVLTSPGD